MSFFNKKKILITHNGAFHTDDLFATATLSILNNGNIKIIRSRDPKIFAKGDYVYDVGGEYDGNHFFDHHQKGGAGFRENGVPYSSFGLIWRAFGEKICESKEIFEEIDQKIVQPIDAIDNGMDITIPKFANLDQYTVNSIFKAFYPTWKEDASKVDTLFKKEVEKVVILLKREIKVAKDNIEGKKIIIEDYNNSQDKRIIILSKPFHRFLVKDVLPKFPEPLYYICPSNHSDEWKVEAVPKDSITFENRKSFPESWCGFTNGNQELKKITEVNDIIFCHKSGFLAHIKSKEGAIKLAEKALSM